VVVKLPIFKNILVPGSLLTLQFGVVAHSVLISIN
jgi:hypothetical protein